MTLIEMLVTIALLSAGVVGVAAGVAATERTAAINQDQSQLEVAMRQVSDYVRDSSSRGLPYQVCVSSYPNSSLTLSGLDWKTQVDESVPNSDLRSPGNVAIPTVTNGQCTRTPTQWDYGVQEIWVTVCDKSCANPSNRSLTRIVWKSQSW